MTREELAKELGIPGYMVDDPQWEMVEAEKLMEMFSNFEVLKFGDRTVTVQKRHPMEDPPGRNDIRNKLGPLKNLVDMYKTKVWFNASDSHVMRAEVDAAAESLDYLTAYEPHLEQEFKDYKEKHPRLTLRSDKMELLQRYSDHLMKQNYVDADLYAEPPSEGMTVIDEFMKTEPAEQPTPTKADSLRLAEILTLYGEDKIGLHTAIVEIEEYASQQRLTEDRLVEIMNLVCGDLDEHRAAAKAILAEQRGDKK